jgi:hypothetical protein
MFSSLDLEYLSSWNEITNISIDFTLFNHKWKIDVCKILFSIHSPSGVSPLERPNFLLARAAFNIFPKEKGVLD